MIRKLFLPILTSTVQVAAAVAALGRPDLTTASEFLKGNDMGAAASIATASVFLWAMVIVITLVSLGHALAAALRSMEAERRKMVWAGAVMTVGLIVLGAGAVRHYTPTISMYGGSAQEAQQLASR